MVERTGPMTAEELERLYIPGKKVELVRGVPVVQELPSSKHGLLAFEIGYQLGSFVRPRGLGYVFAQDTGFLIETDPDTVRGADVAFVALERLPEIPSRGYVPLAPDLVVEILSPGDRPGEVLKKVGEWLDAGARLVWVLDPDRRDARVHRADGSVSLLGHADSLDGEDAVPGFSLPLADFW